MPDNLVANRREKLYVASRLPPNIFYPPAGCAAHKCTRIATAILEEDDHVGDTYATQFTCQLVAYQNRMQRVLWEMVCDELLILDGSIFPLDPAWRAHTKHVMTMMYARRDEYLRGRIGEDGALFVGNTSEAKQAKIDKVCDFLNYDTRLPRLAHVEVGCCPGGLEQQRQNVFSAIIEGDLILSEHQQLPSKHRIGSMDESNARQCAGFMICEVLQRLVVRSFSSSTRMTEAESVEPGYRAMVKQKITRTLSCMQPANVMMKVLLSYVAHPISHLFMRLQFLDNAGSILQELSKNATNPFRHTFNQYIEMLVSDFDTGPLASLFYHVAGGNDLASDAAEVDSLIDTLREKISAFALMVRWKLLDYYNDYPFAFAKFVDETLSLEARRQLITEFLQKRRCELEPDMALKVPRYNMLHLMHHQTHVPYKVSQSPNPNMKNKLE